MINKNFHYSCSIQFDFLKLCSFPSHYNFKLRYLRRKPHHLQLVFMRALYPGPIAQIRCNKILLWLQSFSDKNANFPEFFLPLRPSRDMILKQTEPNVEVWLGAKFKFEFEFEFDISSVCYCHLDISDFHEGRKPKNSERNSSHL